MADKQQPVQEKKQTKKEVRKHVYEKLAGALADYKTGIGEKKFESRLRKASKLFAVNITNASKKQSKVKTKKKSTV